MRCAEGVVLLSRSVTRIEPQGMIGEIGGYPKMPEYGHADVQVRCARLRIDRRPNPGETPPRQLELGQREDLARCFSPQPTAMLGAHRSPIGQQMHARGECITDQDLRTVPQVKGRPQGRATLHSHRNRLHTVLGDQFKVNAARFAIARQDRKSVV